MSTSIPATYDQALERARAALALEGFGMLAEMDIAATAMDPVEALDLTGNAEIRPIAEEVRTRLRRVLQHVEHSGGSAAPADRDPHGA